MRLISNHLSRKGLPADADLAQGEICQDPTAALELLSACPMAQPTPLLEMPALAAQLGVESVLLKDERMRMGLGSFKALGAAFAIAKLASENLPNGRAESSNTALAGQTFVCASAGNHGLSMAAGAALFGADALVYLSDTVPEDFARRLRSKGAKVIRQGANYEASMQAAIHAAELNRWHLLSDSSWPGYTEPARDVMEGYLIMGAEVADQIERPPTHIFIQAGVGGLAAACTATARSNWGRIPKICVVEPEYAPALMNSILAGKAVAAKGPVSNMGRLDCKEPSHLALKYLAIEADFFMAITDEEATGAVTTLGNHKVTTSPSGAAGLAGLLCAGEDAQKLGIDPNSRVLLYISEGRQDE